MFRTVAAYPARHMLARNAGTSIGRTAVVSGLNHVDLFRSVLSGVQHTSTTNWVSSNHIYSKPLAAFSTSVDLPPPPTSNHPYSPLANAQGSVLYTETDEAPALATYSLYPIISKVRTL